jgi:hypothetical protein
MTYIKWQEEPFTVDVFGQELSFFYYGNYGGPDYPDKQELVTDDYVLRLTGLDLDIVPMLLA